MASLSKWLLVIAFAIFCITRNKGQPVLSEAPVDVVAEIGSDIMGSIGCSYQGNQLEPITWTLDGSSDFLQFCGNCVNGFNFGTTSASSLTFTNVDLRYAGEITCSVVDGNGNTAHSSFNLTIEVPSSISDNPNNTETLRDTNVMLHCQAKGIPLPTIVWYKDSVGPVFDSVEVFSTTINETTVRSTIVFSNATWRDSGSYYCSAHNVLQSRGGNVTSANSTTALLVVYYPVYLIDYPVTVIGHAGSAIVIECKFAGYLNPQPSLTKWYYNGAEITSSNRVTIDIVSESLDYYGYVNTSLLIDNAAVNDTGVYRCESENCAPDCFSREEGNISVTINHPPYVSTELDYIVVNVTESVSITCTIYGVPLPLIKWSYTDLSYYEEILNPSSLPQGISITDTVLNNSTTVSVLAITNITKQREGFYTCSGENGITNVIDSPENVSVEVFVQVPPLVSTDVSGTVYKLPGTEVMLLFNITNASPSVVISDIKWIVLYSNNVAMDITDSLDNRYSFSDDLLSLSIDSLQSNDTGLYTVIATNPAGISNSSISLYIGVFPLVNYSSGDTATLNDTDNIAITCDIEADPSADVTWLFNGELLIQDNIKYDFNGNNSKLTISSIRYTDNGVYTCTGSNVFGSVNDTMILSVQVPPTILLSPVSSVTVSAGEDISISCNATGEPPPDITWLKDDALITADNEGTSIINMLSYSVSSSSLTIVDVTLLTAGVYYCNASNDVVTVIRISSDESDVRILYPPNITATSEESLVFNYTDTFEIFCQLSGIPAPNISWFLDGVLLQNLTDLIEISDSYQTLSLNLEVVTSSLKVLKASKSYEGNYTCVGENIADNLINADNSHTTSVFVQVPPLVLSNGPNTVIAVTNLTLTISFTVHNDSPPIQEPRWTFTNSNGDIYQLYPNDNNDDDADYYVFSNDLLSLTIMFVEFADEGNYSIFVQNEAGSSSTYIAVDVETPPVIINSSSTVDIIEGEEAILHCIAEGEPLHDIVWIAPDQSIITFNTDKYELTTSGDLFGTLTIQNTTFSDSGQYRCTVTNIHGNDSLLVYLSVQVPPVSIVSPPSSILKHGGQSVSLLCVFGGYPIPSITWFKDNELLTDLTTETAINTTTMIVSSELILVNLTYNDTGVYYCQADNNLVMMLTSTSSTTNITINYPTDIIYFEGTPNITENLPYSITCEVFGRPAPIISWSTNNVSMNRYIINTTTTSTIEGYIVSSVFTINSTIYTDTGVYNCTAINNANGNDSPPVEESASIFVTILTAPVLHRITNNSIIGILGETVTIEFTLVRAVPPVSIISWNFTSGIVDGEQFNGVLSSNLACSINSSNCSLSQDRYSLTLYNVSVTDEGMYTITTQNTVDIVSLSVLLDIEVPATIIQPPIDNAVISGNDAMFVCIGDSEPIHTSSWTYNSIPLTNGTEYAIIIQDYYTTILTVMNTSLTDAGVYSCIITNQYNTDTANATLNVQVPPVNIVSPPSSILKHGGQSVSLLCVFGGYPIPSITWFKDNELLTDLTTETAINTTTMIVSSELILVNLTYNDTGVYYCQADNNLVMMLTSTSSTTNITINYPTDIIYFEGTPNITENLPYSITCEVFGRPAPIISWSTNNVSMNRYIINTTTTSTIEGYIVSSVFTINSTIYTDTGVYNCTAINNANGNDSPPIEESASIFVTILTAPVLHRITNNSIIGILGETVTIEFTIIRAVPPVSIISWNFTSGIVDGEQFNGVLSSNLACSINSSNCSLSQDRYSLTLYNVSVTDEGMYTITTQNTVDIVSLSVLLDIEVPATIIQPPIDNAVISGNDAMFVCIGDSEPIHTSSWTYNSIPLTNGTEYTIIIQDYYTTILTVMNTSLTDAGVYSCIITNQYNTDTANATLNVQDPPLVTGPPFNTNVTAGDNVTIQCAAYGYPIPNIKWFKNNNTQLLSSNKNVIITHNDDPSTNVVTSTLTLLHVTGEDAGMFSCVANNSLVEERFDTGPNGVLYLLFPPNVTVNPSTILVNQSDTFSIKCSSTGVPPPTFTWQHIVNGTITTVRNDQMFIITEQVEESLLTVAMVTKSNEGVYRCVGYNGVVNLLNTPEQNDVVVTVQVPPLIQVTDNITELVVILGTPIIISIEEAQASPPVQSSDIQWTFANFSLSNEPTVLNSILLSNNRLTFTKNISSLSDEGYYAVLARNPAGISMITIHIIIEAPPTIITPPTDVLQYEGLSVTFQCVAFSKPLYTVTWLLNNEVIIDDSEVNEVNETMKYIIDNDPSSDSYGLLTVYDIEQNDLGFYTCNVSNIHGYSTATAGLLFLVEPILSVLNYSFDGLEGQPAAINLSIIILNKPHPPINIIRWFHNNKELDVNTNKYLNMYKGDTIQLSILNVVASDAGIYDAIVGNIAGSDSTSFNITIQASPFVNDSGLSYSNEVIPFASYRELVCLYDGIPEPEVVWLKDLDLINPSQFFSIVESVFIDDLQLRPNVPVYKSVLISLRLEELDNGSYSCRATNKHGSALMAHPYIIRVEPEFIDFCAILPCKNGECQNEPSSYNCICDQGWIGLNCSEAAIVETAPVITMGPQLTYKELNSQVTLNCVAMGNPQPSVRWFKDKLEITGANTAQYTIKRLDLTTRGQYYCEATNKLGTITSEEVYVKIRGLVQFRVLLDMTMEFADILIDEGLVRRQIPDNRYAATSENLAKLVSIVNSMKSEILGQSSENDLASYFQVQLQNETLIRSLLDPIPIVITLIVNDLANTQENVLLSMDILTRLTSALTTLGYSDGIELGTISRFDGCVAEVTINYPFDNITEIPFILPWQATDIGQSFSIKCPCGPDDFDIGVRRFATRLCGGTFIDGAMWLEPDDDECSMFSLSARRLCELASLEEFEEQLDGLNNITGNTEDIASLEISISTVFVEDLDVEVTGNQTLSLVYLDVVNNLLTTDDEGFSMSNDEANSSSRILSSFEDVLNNFPAEVDNVLIVRTKYAASVQEFESDENELAELTFTVNSNFGRKNSTQSIDFEEKDDNSTASIVLPRSVLNATLGNDSVSSRIIFTVFDTEKLFFRRNTIAEREKYLVVGSAIVSASVFYDGEYNTSLTDLEEPVIVTLRKNETLKDKAQKIQCSFWDPTADDGFGNWSSEGCRKMSETNDTVVCACDHLTSFALILDVAPLPEMEVLPPPELKILLTYFTLIGNCVSIICLVIIILTYTIDKKLRRSHNGKLLLNLCFAYLGLNFSFILAVHISQHVYVLCILTSAALHYFLLASFLAMASEATVLYLELVRIFSTGKDGLPLKAAISTWITPLFIVGLAIAPNYTAYANDEFCIPVGWQFIVGCIIPFICIYVYNWVLFVIIITSIKKQQGKMKNTTGNKSLQTNFKQQTMLLLTLSLLFGLGWSLGLAATNSLPILWLRTTFEFIFIGLTGFQGLFIFLLYGVRLRNIRRVWLKWIYTIGGQRSKAASLELSAYSIAGARRKQPTYNLGTYQTASSYINSSSSSDNKVKPVSFRLSPTGTGALSPDLKVVPSPSSDSSLGQITESTIKEKVEDTEKCQLSSYLLVPSPSSDSSLGGQITKLTVKERVKDTEKCEPSHYFRVPTPSSDSSLGLILESTIEVKVEDTERSELSPDKTDELNHIEKSNGECKSAV